MTKAKELARQHWGYVGMITERMYLDAFEHGYKHGVEDAAKSSQVPKRGPTIDEQIIRHSQAPFDDDVSTQDDIKAFWDEREKQKAGTPEDSRSSY